MADNKEYIERGAVLEAITYNPIVKSTVPDVIDITLAVVQKYIRKVPAADVVEVRHGEWIRKDGFLVCSECDATKPYAVLNDTINYWRCDYCNRCGERKGQSGV